MKRSLGKVALMLAAATVALAALSVGYGLWAKTLTISGTVNTGNINMLIENAVANDPLPCPEPPPAPPTGPVDPLRECTWNGSGWDCGPVKYCELVVPGPGLAPVWTCSSDPADGTNLGCTEALVATGGKTLSIYLHKPYILPVGGYCPTVNFDIVNRGTVPVIVTEVAIDTTGAEEPAGSGVLALNPTFAGLAFGDVMMPGVPFPSSMQLCMTTASEPGVVYNVTVTATGHNYNEP